jgi:hypothetical protein
MTFLELSVFAKKCPISSSDRGAWRMLPGDIGCLRHPPQLLLEPGDGNGKRRCSSVLDRRAAETAASLPRGQFTPQATARLPSGVSKHVMRQKASIERGRFSAIQALPGKVCGAESGRRAEHQQHASASSRLMPPGPSDRALPSSPINMVIILNK